MPNDLSKTSINGQPYYCDCSECDWEQMVETEQEGKIICTLHVLTKHPDLYRQTTGKDPEQSTVEYVEYIRLFRAKI